MPDPVNTVRKGADPLKITLEPAQVRETEVIIRGDVASPEVAAILQMLGKKNSGKLLLYKEDEQFVANIRDIVFLETRENKVLAFTAGDTYETRLKLYELMELLESHPFAQISKSTIVNIDFVRSIQAEFSGNYCIKLRDRKETLTVSRKYFKAFKERI